VYFMYSLVNALMKNVEYNFCNIISIVDAIMHFS